MRNGMRVFVATVAVLACGAAGARAGTPESKPVDVGAGRIAWFDIATTDLAKAKAFYGAMFGWEFAEAHGTGATAEIAKDGQAIGTIRVADGAISGFNGVVYVQVDDVAAACAKATELGAKVIAGFPFDLPNGTGAIGLFLDPSGHPMGLYSRTLLAAKAAAKG